MSSKYDQFNLVTDFELRGDQARAIDELVEGLHRGDKAQVLLGVTGSGKTFTMAQCIARVNRPTLVMAHNKTLAAQLYQEFRRFFPQNAVEYFVSYYDYYQPEAYVPTTDSYIEKEATINDEIDRMRLSATRSLFERRDVIIVASVSCIYGLGSPEAYYGMMLPLEHRPGRGQPHPIDLLVDGRFFLDVGIGGRDVGLGLVVVVIADEVLDGVLREEPAELLVELRGQRLVVDHHEGGPVDRLDDLGHREGLAGSRHAQQHLAEIPPVEPLDQLGYGARLVPFQLEVRDKCEFVV